MLRAFLLRSLVYLRRYWWLPAIILVCGVPATMFPPEVSFFRSAAKYAVQIMLIYFILSLLFLMLRQYRLMFVGFICCAVLCLYLRRSMGNDDVSRITFATETKEAQLRIVHFNTSATDGDIEKTIKAVLHNKPDIISIQEVTPEWDEELRALLAPRYPYFRSFRQIDYSGLALYSRYPFARIDTFQIDHVPNIISSIRIDSLHPDVFLAATHTPPPTSGYAIIRKHLDRIAQQISPINEPMLTFGDYNVVPWSSEIQAFRSKTGLSDGRRYIAPNSPTPIDFIFFSKHFNCLSFEPLVLDNAVIGCEGRYQFKTDFRMQ
jgi:endonuclease/exonuclease/phosphatase (EEP) superfamily protein YafD